MNIYLPNSNSWKTFFLEERIKIILLFWLLWLHH